MESSPFSKLTSGPYRTVTKPLSPNITTMRTQGTRKTANMSWREVTPERMRLERCIQCICSLSLCPPAACERSVSTLRAAPGAHLFQVTVRIHPSLTGQRCWRDNFPTEGPARCGPWPELPGQSAQGICVGTSYIISHEWNGDGRLKVALQLTHAHSRAD